MPEPEETSSEPPSPYSFKQEVMENTKLNANPYNPSTLRLFIYLKCEGQPKRSSISTIEEETKPRQTAKTFKAPKKGKVIR